MFNNDSNVSTTIICEKGVGQHKLLILTTFSVSIVDDSCKACKFTETVYMRIVSIFEQSQLQII